MSVSSPKLALCINAGQGVDVGIGGLRQWVSVSLRRLKIMNYHRKIMIMEV